MYSSFSTKRLLPEGHQISILDSNNLMVSKVGLESIPNFNTLFEDSNNYLKSDPNIIIGKYPAGPRYLNNKVVPYSIVGSNYEEQPTRNKKRNQFDSTKSMQSKIIPTTPTLLSKASKKANNAALSSPFKKCNFNMNPSLLRQTSRKPTLKSLNQQNSITQSTIIMDKEKEEDKIELVSDFQLKHMYERKREIIKSNDINSFMKNVTSKEVINNLKMQEHTLKKHELELEKFKKLSTFLVDKTRKEQEGLLVKKIEEFRIKNEVNSLLEAKKSKKELFRDSFGKNLWVMQLRRPKDFTGSRYGYINDRSANDLWQVKKDTFSKEPVVIIRNPSLHNIDSSTLNQTSNLLNQSSFLNSHYLSNTLETNNISIKDYEEICKLTVEGQNLLDVEQEQSLQMQGRKYLHKKKDQEKGKEDEVLETIEENYEKPLRRRLKKIKGASCFQF